MTIKYLALAATALVLAAPSFAQRGPQMTPEEREAAFVKADANKDGKLDKAELKMTLPAEFQAQVDDERLGQMMARRDADKDGFVSKAEYTAPPQRPAQ
jgi:Ca2+-binding EF-hand superfamily protein